MPYRKGQFVNQEIYHIVSRSIDDNLLFKDVNDYYRGIFSIYEFNNDKPVSIKHRREIRARFKKVIRGPTSDIRGRASDDSDNRNNLITNNIIEKDERAKFLEVLAFCLMPNHIHLLLRQLKNNGITKFMAKFGSGYGGYFNRKYKRKGYVFQDRFKDVHITDDNQFKIVTTYIFTNPTSLVEPGWKEKGIKSLKKTRSFLENYKWSSYLDCIGIKNFPSVTDREFLLKIMGKERGCKEAVENWIRYKKEINKFPEIFLDQ